MAPKLWWSVRKRIARLGGRYRLARRDGATFLLDTADWLDLQILIGRPYETEQFALFSRLARERGATRFLDCGANFGLYAARLPAVVPSVARIDAFEPLASVRWRLSANLGLNGLAAIAHVHAVALGAADGEATLSVDPRSTGISALAPSEEERQRRDFRIAETVRVVRLDDHLPPTGERTAAIKLDVEGHEAEALAGMAETLRRDAAVLQVEARPRNREAVTRLAAAAGLAPAGAVGDDLFFVGPR